VSVCGARDGRPREGEIPCSGRSRRSGRSGWGRRRGSGRRCSPYARGAGLPTSPWCLRLRRSGSWKRATPKSEHPFGCLPEEADAPGVPRQRRRRRLVVRLFGEESLLTRVGAVCGRLRAAAAAEAEEAAQGVKAAWDCTTRCHDAWTNSSNGLEWLSSQSSRGSRGGRERNSSMIGCNGNHGLMPVMPTPGKMLSQDTMRS
jgi:hypothetical protein